MEERGEIFSAEGVGEKEGWALLSGVSRPGTEEEGPRPALRGPPVSWQDGHIAHVRNNQRLVWSREVGAGPLRCQMPLLTHALKTVWDSRTPHHG